MQDSYTITAKSFVENLVFDYVETYSFQRGEAFEKQSAENLKTYANLKVRKERRDNLSPEENTLFEELQDQWASIQYITNGSGILHPSAELTHRFEKGEPEIERFMEIMRLDFEQEVFKMCGPEYRDAILFYDATGQITTVLNVCLSCDHMQTQAKLVKGNCMIFEHLRAFFIDLGHAVER